MLTISNQTFNSNFRRKHNSKLQFKVEKEVSIQSSIEKLVKSPLATREIFRHGFGGSIFHAGLTGPSGVSGSGAGWNTLRAGTLAVAEVGAAAAAPVFETVTL